jgi:glycosyltransferase involved in cell wall biosynthesis
VKVINLIDNQKDKLTHELWVACILKAPNYMVESVHERTEVIRLGLKPIEKLLSILLARGQTRRTPEFLVRYAMEGLSNLYKNKLLPLMKDCDVIHCVHGGVSYLGHASFKASQCLAIPFVYTPLLHLYHKEWLKEKEECRRSKRTFVYRPKLDLAPRRWTDSFWYELCFRADALITMTDFEKRFFVQKGIPDKRVHSIGVGPLLPDFSMLNINLREELKGLRYVLFLGRNVEYKGIEELLQAAGIVWKEFPDIFFVFAGPKEGKSDELYALYRHPQIRVLGWVSEEDKASLLHGCTIFCMPSLEESLGGTFLEAWMFEKPVIGARIAPLIELTGDGEGGFLVNPDPDEIARSILVLLRDPDLRQRMGRWGKKRVCDSYSWDGITKRMEGIYSHLFGHPDIEPEL